ncbi:MAG: HIT domain-containing protein [Nanoarchaeota archaeon]|nr:HIT domain-containing protein [Nanoarchaeota archaeon]
MPEPTEEQRKRWEEKIKNMDPEELQELQRQQCIFCQIVTGKIPSKKAYEDSACLAILDINPAAKGHILLLPKEHYAIMPQVPEKVLGHLSTVAKNLSQVLLKVLRADGTTIFIANGAAAGQRAQHFMIHLIPRKTGDGVLPAEEGLVGTEMAAKVKAAIEQKLLALLGGKKPMQKDLAQKAESEQETKLPLKEAEIFITSAAAKRYHKEKCPFAQNIPAEKKIILSKEEAEKSARKPCTCVSGKRIPLVKPASSSKPKQSKGLPAKKTSGSKASAIPKTKRGGEASLDDIAHLFK